MKYIRARYVVLASVLLMSSHAIAGETPVFNTDLPGGNGDYENNERYFKVKCRILSGPHRGRYNSNSQMPPGYYCKKAHGAWCVNKETQPKNSCANMKVKWKWKRNQWRTGSNWAAGSTPWFDRDRPSGNGDYEVINLQLKATCYIGGQAYTAGSTLPAGYTCNNYRGAWCENAKTQPRNACRTRPVTIKWSW